MKKAFRKDSKKKNAIVPDMQPIDPPVGGCRISLLGLFHALRLQFMKRWVVESFSQRSGDGWAHRDPIGKILAEEARILPRDSKIMLNSEPIAHFPDEELKAGNIVEDSGIPSTLSSPGSRLTEAQQCKTWVVALAKQILAASPPGTGTLSLDYPPIVGCPQPSRSGNIRGRSPEDCPRRRSKDRLR